MKISEIISIIEAVAPLSLQEPWDNSGLQVGRTNAAVSGIVLALDVSENTVDFAVKNGANLIISHHPLIFDGVKTITEHNAQGRIILDAISAGITIYSAHTPIDACVGGINDYIASVLELKNVAVLGNSEAETGIGRVGDLPKKMSAEQFASVLKDKFALPCVRSAFGDGGNIVSRIALCSGGGASEIENAISSGADCYICGDLKYHDFQNAAGRITLFDIGHAESEICVTDIFMKILTPKTKNIAIFALQDSYTRYF